MAVDVGGGGMGGAPNNPVMLGSTPYPSGWNHAAYPYRSKSTGKFLMIGGDEAFPYQLMEGPRAPAPGGRLDPHLRVGRVGQPQGSGPLPGAGGGDPQPPGSRTTSSTSPTTTAALRVVDISGEMRGDLYRQGREIAMFRPFDPETVKPRTPPSSGGRSPTRAHIFIADNSSGLWAVKLVDAEPRNLGEPH